MAPSASVHSPTLAGPAGAPPLSLEPLTRWCMEVVQRALSGAPSAVDAVPPLPAHLAKPLTRHGFDRFDDIAVALILAPDLDPVLGVAMSQLTGSHAGRYPTVSVIGDLVGAEGASRVRLAARLSPGAPLVRSGLIQTVPPADAPVVGTPPRGPSLIDTCVAGTALLRWTFGITQLDPALFPLVRDDLTAPVVPPHAISARNVAQRLRLGHPSITSLVGPHDADALATALHGARRTGRAALVVSADALIEPAPAARVAAEALLREAVVIATGDVTAVPPHRWETFETVLAVGQEPRLSASAVHDTESVIVRRVGRASVGAHLVSLLRTRGLRLAPAEAARIARWEHLRHEQLGHLADVLAARSHAHAAGAAASVTARDVATVMVATYGDDLARLATPLETSRDWSQLVLPEALRRELRELTDQAQHRTRLLEESGFSAIPGQPRGMTVVFAGPSGTGKTHAARLVSGELGLPLYAVNLAATVSKYIGETERNLDAVFAAAERTDAVLLFDEAEALFGKRSEVQDARDRYANLEISFLLQRMERYDGVAILATNLLGHFDDAFARRLSFCLRFPYPDDAQRRQIWRAVWPDRIVLGGDVDLDAIAARHPLSGGHIRNIALASIHLARTNRGVVDAACLHRAIDREYSKLGQVADEVGERVP